VALVVGFQRVEILYYKPENWEFDSRWGPFFFDWPNPSSHTMAVGSTRPLTEMSTRNLPGAKGSRRVRLTTLPPSMSRLYRKMWEPQRLTTLWASTACHRESFMFWPFISVSPANSHSTNCSAFVYSSHNSTIHSLEARGVAKQPTKYILLHGSVSFSHRVWA
jgi:hypothetical protein